VTEVNWLDLSHNAIDKLHRLTTLHMFPAPFRSLEELHVSHNVISEIASDTFAGMELSLRTLDLSYNRLKWLPQSMANMRALSTLYLHSNRLIQLPPMFVSLSSVTGTFHENPIVCSCAAAWVVNYTVQFDETKTKCTKSENQTQELFACFILRECPLPDNVFVTKATINACGAENYVQIDVRIRRISGNICVVNWTVLGPGQPNSYDVSVDFSNTTLHHSGLLFSNVTEYALYVDEYIPDATIVVCVKALDNERNLVLANRCVHSHIEDEDVTDSGTDSNDTVTTPNPAIPGSSCASSTVTKMLFTACWVIFSQTIT
jgi:hypothetical protein